MKKLLVLSIIFSTLVSCKTDEDPKPTMHNQQPQSFVQPQVVQDETNHEGMVKFTLYSNRVPYIWKRVVNGSWIQDSIKTNDAIVYEPYDERNRGVGYFVTMNTSGKITDSLHIKAEYNGKYSEMSSVKYQSFAYVKLEEMK